MIYPPKVKRPLTQTRLKIEFISSPLDHRKGDYDEVSYCVDGIGYSIKTKPHTSYDKTLIQLENLHGINSLDEKYNKVDYRDGEVVFRGEIVSDVVCFTNITSTKYCFKKDSTHGYFVDFEVYCDHRLVYSKGWSYSNCEEEIDLTIKTFEEINEFIFE